MSVKVQVEFIAGATVAVRAYVYDEDDALVTPTSIKVTIKDPDGTTQVDAATMTQYGSVTGTYDYFYNTTTATDTGKWYGEVVVVDGSGATAKTSIEPFGFKMK